MYYTVHQSRVDHRILCSPCEELYRELPQYTLELGPELAELTEIHGEASLRGASTFLGLLY